MNTIKLPSSVIKNIVSEAILLCFGENVLNSCDFTVTSTKCMTFGDYQTNCAIIISQILNSNSLDVADTLFVELNKKLDNYAFADVAHNGFINFSLCSVTINNLIKSIFIGGCLDTNGNIKLIEPLTVNPKNIFVDFSSPNIAKPMHIGHLRSTIIGDVISNIAEYFGHKVIRVNHLGDWGTQFGILITYIMDNNIDIDDIKSDLELLTIYKKSNELKSSDDFMNRSRKNVVKLQNGDKKCIDLWNKLCKISINGFNEIYELLDIKNLIIQGESYYQPMLNNLVLDLLKRKIVKISNKAVCYFDDAIVSKEKKIIPMIIRKQDGGFNYATTDIAAIKHRSDNNADWLIYVTDSGQDLHFNQIFSLAKKAGFIKDNIKIDHVPFGMIGDISGKRIRTRSGDVLLLKDFIEDAIDICFEDIKKRTQNDRLLDDEMLGMSKVLAIGAIKFSDLICNRRSNYKFDFDRMFKISGKSSVFVNYAYVRLISIISKAGYSIRLDVFNVDFPFDDNISYEENILIRNIIKFPEIIFNTLKQLMPNILASYVYDLASLSNNFLENCKVIGSGFEHRRIVLCKITASLIEKAMRLMGITLLSRM